MRALASQSAATESAVERFGRTLRREVMWSRARSDQDPALISGGNLQAKLVVGSAGDCEQEADRVANEVMRMPSAGLDAPTAPFAADGTGSNARVARTVRSSPTGVSPSFGGEIPGVVGEVIRSQGRPLDAPTRAFMEPRLDRDFGRVRVHSDDRAAESARALGAEAYAVGQHVVFAENRYAPSTTAGARLLAHELTHTVQQETGGGLAGVLRRSPNSLAAYPEAERLRIQQSSAVAASVDDSYLRRYFGNARQNGGFTSVLRFAGSVVFGPAIADALQPGLESIGTELASHIPGSTANTMALELNSTLALSLDLRPYQGPSACFRFTRLSHTEGRATTEILLIESTGAASAGFAAAPVPQSTNPNVPTTFMVRGETFTLRPSWNDAQYGRLLAVLERLPETALREAADLKFSLQGRGTTEEAGHYEPTRDEVELHLNAFPIGASVLGGADTGMQAITHEIGHAIDLRRLYRRRTSLPDIPTPAQMRTISRDRSASGSRWQAEGGRPSETEMHTRIADTAFRQAAIRDRIRVAAATPSSGPTSYELSGGPTPYSNATWRELFAESFTIFVHDPNLLRTLRPNLYRYFSTNPWASSPRARRP